MKTRGRLKYIVIAAIIVAHSFVAIIPSNNIYAEGISGAGEEKAKNFLYALRLYNCFRIPFNMVHEKMTTKGLKIAEGSDFPSKLTKILTDPDADNASFDPTLEDSWLGTITCRKAMNALFGSDAEITKSMIEEGGLLYGAYGLAAYANWSYVCEYKIWNDNMSGYVHWNENGDVLGRKRDPNMPGNPAYDWDRLHFEDDVTFRNRMAAYDDTAYWPMFYTLPLHQPKEGKELLRDFYQKYSLAGYLYVGIEHIFPSSVVEFYMNDENQLEAIGLKKTGDRYNSADQDFENGKYTVPPKDVTDRNGWKYVEDWRYNFMYGGNEYGCDDLLDFSTYRWTPLKPWKDANLGGGAWLHKALGDNSMTDLSYPITEGTFGVGPYVDQIKTNEPSDGTLEIIDSTDGAGLVIAQNIKQIFFDGQNPEDYLASHSDIAYTLYGRYIFNGDSNFPNASNCNGISIKSDDPRLQELQSHLLHNWNANVLSTQAYESSDSTSKTNFSTKIGAANVSAVGDDKEVVIHAKANPIKCSELIAKFNGLNPGATPEAKDAVYGYISPITVDSILGSATEPPSTDPPSTDPPSTDPPAVEPTVEADPEDTCYDNAGSLGWLLCPIIVGLQDVILETYAKWVVPALQVDARLFHAGGATDTTYVAWDIFRQIANYLFIVVFIIVIFSQITGVGIEKYGIKRLLPKLIISAIMINLSFLICQLAIDIGNIIGHGIGGIFNTISQAITPADSFVVEGVEVGSMAWESFMSSGWNVALVIIVAILGVAAVLSQGLAIIIPVAMAFLSILISVITLIAILGMRQAAIVLLVVASPIAFLCYLLPNTKTIFDKWFNAFKTMLITFPICSALIYGGNMASMILLNASSGNTWLIIAAAAIGIAPIFVIPKVIKNCMGAISVGMARFGSRAGGRAKGAAARRMDNSFLTRRRNYNQQMRNQKAAMRSSSYNAKRGKKVLSHYNNDPSKLNKFQKRKYYAARGAVNANNQEMESAYSSDYANRTDGDIIGELNAAAKGGTLNSNMLASGLKNIHSEARLASTLRSLSGTKAYQDLMNNDPTMRERISSALRSRDGVISQSMGKVMNSKDASGNYRTDINKMFSDGTLRDEVRRAGAGVMKDQNHDVFETEGAEDLFSDQQLLAGATSEYSGATAEAYHELMTGSKMVDGKSVKKVSDSRKQSMIASMTPADATKLRIVRNEAGKDVGSLDALGGAKAIAEHNPTIVTTLNSSAGDNLRGNMQTEVKDQLGIKRD